jgi:diguanylate cyclase (GGDEF)-like protein/PAS domain S-box-containing protein
MASTREGIPADESARMGESLQAGLIAAGLIGSHEERPVDPQTIIDNLPLGFLILEFDRSGHPRCVLVNRQFERFIGASRSTLIGCRIDKVPALSDGHPLLDGFERCLHRRHPIMIESETEAVGTNRFIDYRFTPVFDAHGEVVQVLVTVIDRTEDRRTQHEIVRTALHDALTQLPNRHQFVDRLEQIGHRSMRDPDLKYAVMSLNIDRFKGINESLGHTAGDNVLVAVTQRLSNLVPPAAVLARLGSDEFAILLVGVGDPSTTMDVADRIHTAMEAPFEIRDQEVFLSFSIGIASNTSGRDKPADVMRNADLAMHRAKAAGKSRTEIYQQDLHAKASSLLRLENDLRRAIDRHELSLYYQPIVCMRTGELTGFEALARWFHKERGPIPPNEFIPISEATGTVGGLGRWALEEACQQLADWHARYPRHAALTVAVNISGVHFMRDDLFRDTLHALERSGLKGKSLKIELTESAIMENADLTAQVLKEIKTLNVDLALDDFGTGYSSLSYLNRFPIDVLKIDHSFVRGMESNPENAKIVNVIAMLAKTLGLDIVAEGVETPRQAALIKTLGCDFAQGYLFSRPLPVDAMEELLQRDTTWPPELWAPNDPIVTGLGAAGSDPKPSLMSKRGAAILDVLLRRST